MSNTRIWIDLTDIRSWSGHFTGIQRVVFNLADNFDKKCSVNFFYYDENRREFFITDFSEIEDKFTQIEIDNELKNSIDLKSIALDYYSKIPLKIRNALPKKFKQKGKKLAISVYKASISAKNKSKKNYANKIVDFNENDTVVVFGNNWDRDIYMNDLSVKKYEKNLKIYMLVYDLIPAFHPQLFGAPLFGIFCKYMFRSISICEGLLCISKSTEKDVRKFCKIVGLSVPDTTVVRLGDTLPSIEPEPVKAIAGKQFILCVGTVEVRKNHTLLYYAWKEGIRRGIDMPMLIIVGRPGWYTENICELIRRDPEVRDKIAILNDTKDTNLAWLYQNCKFTIYPSFYEGWGLPIAESLAYGKLCLSSNTSSMPEIAGDLIDYFSPYDSRECLQKIMDYIDSDTKLRAKEEEIIRNYKPTTWSLTYEASKTFIIKD